MSLKDNSASDSYSASSTSSSAAAATTSASTSSGNKGATSSFTPNGKKAGVSTGDAFDELKDIIGWWWGERYPRTTPVPADARLDYSPEPSGHSASGVAALSTLWGDGHLGDVGQDAQRLAEFKALSYSPQYIQGFYEPDCLAPMSSDIDPATGEWIGNKRLFLADERSCRSMGIPNCTPPKQRRISPPQPRNVQTKGRDMAHPVQKRLLESEQHVGHHIRSRQQKQLGRRSGGYRLLLHHLRQTHLGHRGTLPTPDMTSTTTDLNSLLVSTIKMASRRVLTKAKSPISSTKSCHSSRTTIGSPPTRILTARVSARLGQC